MGFLDNLEAWLEFEEDIDKDDDIPGYMKTPPEWCDDCTVQDSVCTICGCSHNC